MTYARATFFELVWPFLLTLFVTSLVLLLEKIYRLISLVVDRQLRTLELLQMVFYLLPQMISITIPISVVGAVFVVVIRQSTDSEVVCLRATGCSMWRYSLPIAAFGVAALLLAATFTLWLQPAAYARFTRLQADVLRWKAETKLVPGELNYDFGDKVIRIGGKQVDGQLTAVFIADRVLGPNSSVITATRGRIEVDDSGQRVLFLLEDGNIALPGQAALDFNSLDFGTLVYSVEFEAPETLEVNNTWAASTPALLAEIAELDPGTRRWQIRNLELFTRITNPWICLAFALAAVSMALVDPRSGRSGSYLRGLFLVVAYYVVWIGFKDLVYSSGVPAAVMFIPPGLIGLYGLLRLWQFNADGRRSLRRRLQLTLQRSR